MKNSNKKLNIKNFKKKGFAFSVLSIFLVFLIFGFGSLYLFQDNFTQQAEFTESRILYINGEIEYFKNSYLISSLQFASYNVFNELNIYLETNNKYGLINNNAEKLNELFLEGLTTGNFETNNIPNLDNKSMDYLLDIFINNFNENYYGNFTFNILNLTISESQSYYIDIKVHSTYSITTKDNLSSWNFTDEITFEVPVAGLLDPEFLARGKKKVQIRSSEFYLPTLNWTHDNFNITIENMYASVFYKPSFDYTLGQSYLKRLLGINKGSFYGVVKSLTFDLDIYLDGVYDNALQSKQGELYGNTLMLIDFDNSTSNSTHILDKTPFKINIPRTINMNCTGFGDIIGEFCTFSKSVSIDNSTIPIVFSDKFSISSWVNFNFLTTDIIFLGNSIFEFGVEKSTNKSYFEFDNFGGGKSKVYTNTTINQSIWSHLAVTYSGYSVKFYINGLLENEITVPMPATQTITNQYIGTSTTADINLSIDELGVYSYTLSDEDVATLYSEKKVFQIDYVDSVFKKAISFDGIDDFVQLKHNETLDFGVGDFSACVWFKTPAEFGAAPYQQLFVKRTNPTSMGNFEIELDMSTKQVKGLINSESALTTAILENNKYYFACMTRNSSSGIANLYLDGNLEATFSAPGNINSASDMFIGKDPYASNQHFKGLIDEIKIYNRTLNINEIKLNYRNYESFGKGCCNYIILVNQNALDYNNTAYNHNVSSTSTLFYNYYTDNNFNNITIYESLNFTSVTDTNIDYYNLLLDMCIFEIYNYLDYDPWSRVPSNFARSPGVPRYDWCKNMVSDGIY